MGDPRELEWAKKPDALKESWTARIGTHVYTEFPLQYVSQISMSVDVYKSNRAIDAGTVYPLCLPSSYYIWFDQTCPRWGS